MEYNIFSQKDYIYIYNVDFYFNLGTKKRRIMLYMQKKILGERETDLDRVSLVVGTFGDFRLFLGEKMEYDFLA